jgi:hypothetical protein
MTDSSPTGYSVRSTTTGACRECGAVGTLYNGYCYQMPCQSEANARIRGALGRALAYGVPWVPIDPMDVFDVSGWRCYLCGVDTPKRLRGTIDRAAPELDHVIPLARGGGHLPENVENICRECNNRKGDRTLDEIGVSVTRLSADAVASVYRGNDIDPEERRLRELAAFEEAGDALGCFRTRLYPFTKLQRRNHKLWRLYTIKQGFSDAIDQVRDDFRHIMAAAWHARGQVPGEELAAAVVAASNAAARIASVIRKQDERGHVSADALSAALSGIEELAEVAAGLAGLAHDLECDARNLFSCRASLLSASTEQAKPTTRQLRPPAAPRPAHSPPASGRAAAG